MVSRVQMAVGMTEKDFWETVSVLQLSFIPGLGGNIRVEITAGHHLAGI